MTITLTCTDCGNRLDSAWIRGLRRGEPFVCPHCGRELIETGYVEVVQDGLAAGDEGGREAAA